MSFHEALLEYWEKAAPVCVYEGMGHKILTGRGRALGPQLDVDGEGGTALSLASAKGNLELMRLLLEAGADANHVLQEKLSALTFCVHFGQVAAVEMLLGAWGSSRIWDPARA